MSTEFQVSANPDYELKIQTEIRVADLLALYNKGETRWFLCYNIALMIRPQLEAITKNFFVEDGTPSTGFREYAMIDDGFCSGHFERLIILQISAWTEKYYNKSVQDHTDISGLGFLQGFASSRIFRRNLLELVLLDDRDAVIKVEC